jgi:ribosomal-protein-alanine N-acetyltransferase
MLEIVKITKTEDFKQVSREEFLDFMFVHLDRFGDPKTDINKSIDYAFGENNKPGGFLLAAFYENKLVGGLIMNETGMSGYIPDNILVYVAVDASYRGKGFGAQIVERSFKEAKGSVKLHVEYDNPAKRLYERLGFTTKYAEMRYENK